MGIYFVQAERYKQCIEGYKPCIEVSSPVPYSEGHEAKQTVKRHDHVTLAGRVRTEKGQDRQELEAAAFDRECRRDLIVRRDVTTALALRGAASLTRLRDRAERHRLLDGSVVLYREVYDHSTCL